MSANSGLALQQAYALRMQLDALIHALEGDVPMPECMHPEEAWVAGNFGDPIVCGVCGKVVEQ